MAAITLVLRTAVAAVVVGLSADRVVAREPAEVRAAIQALAAEDADARREAAEVLGASYPESARGIPALIETLLDEEGIVRISARAALRSIAEAALADVERVLTAEVIGATPREDFAPFDRFEALGAEISASVLAQGVQQGSWVAPLVSFATAQEPERLRPVLLLALDSPEPRLRRTAAAALGLLAGVVPIGSGGVEARAAGRRLASHVALWPTKTSEVGKVVPGVLGHSPVGGEEAVDALLKCWRGGRGCPLAGRSLEALDRLAISSIHARHALRTVPLSLQGTRSLIARGEVAEVARRLRPENGEFWEPQREAVDALLASDGVPFPVARSILDLLRTISSPVALDRMAHRLSVVGKAQGDARSLAPELNRLWQVALERGGGAPDWGVWSPGGLAAAWALWRVDRQRTDARDYVARALARGPDGAAEEAGRLLAASGPALAEVLDAVRTGLRREVSIDFLVEAVGGLGSTGAPLARVLGDALDKEAALFRSRLHEGTADSVEGMLATIAKHGVEHVAFPRRAISLIHALERTASPSPAIERALSSISEVAKGDEVRLAVARARRVIARRK